MKTCLLILCLFALLLTGCETVSVGLSYSGAYADYTVKRSVVGQNKSWDILIDANGKQIVPFER
jgi:hypothetical protein